jgi:lysophospholipase L1-like esterase
MLGTLLPATGATAAPAAANGPQPAFFLRDGDKVVFYGDSITCGEWYPTLIETYVLTRFPAWRNRFFMRGVSGDNAGNHKRFARDVVDIKPDALTFMMGYNDAGHRRFEPEKLAKFIENVTLAVGAARAANPQMRILLASPTPSETAVSDDPFWVARDAYPYALLRFGQEEARLAPRLGVGFVDMSTLYGQTMGLGYVMARKAFGLSRDGVHPQQEGQSFIAYHFLRGMGTEPLLAEVVLDAAGGTVVAATGCTVTDLNVAAGTLSFRRSCQALPVPLPPVARPFEFLVRWEDTLNLDRLTVRGLTAPAYAVAVNGETVTEVPAAVLEEGLNLSHYPNTPMYKQAMAVLETVRRKQTLESDFWGRYITTGKEEGNGQPLPGSDAALAAEMAAARARIDAAIAECYRMNVPPPHTLRLTPLDKKIAPFADISRHDLAQAFLTILPHPVNVDWSTLGLGERQVTVTIENPNVTDKSGTVSWVTPGSWKIEPLEQSFRVAAGKKTELTFSLALPDGSPLFPVPTLTARWPWASDWAYPVTDTAELILRPNLSVRPARTVPALTGRREDWSDATRFTLADRYFINSRVKGKRALWDGPADLSATVFLKWDSRALYVAALVRDQDHVREPGLEWRQDMLHLALAYRPEGKPEVRQELGFLANPGQDAISSSPHLADSSGIAFHSRRDPAAGTCFYETAIPWSHLASFTAASGRQFRFNLCVNDEDRQLGKGFNFLEWTPGINYGKHSQFYAILTLGD